ncbi:MAG: SgcJ/EcaC family oxidoreductase [Nitrosomonas ureae]
MNDHEKVILQVLEAYKTAVNAKDVDTFVLLYDQDVTVFDMWGEWSYKGVEAWRRMVIDWFGSLGNERVVVELNSTEVITEHSIAIVHAFVTFKGISAEGEALRAMQNRFTWVLKNREGIWKILHEHSSAPIDFETSKVILQRQ